MNKKLIVLFTTIALFASTCFAQSYNNVSYSNVDDGYYYIVSIQIAQTHISLDLEDILKDEINKIVIEVPVDKSYYDSVYIGEKINDDFRIGSFIMNGSIGNWSVKIIDKRIEKK